MKVHGVKHAKRKSTGPPKGKRVKLDEVAWSEVGASGLDDYEGFYGLEEIDNVDVVKDPSTGIVSFQQLSENTKAAKSSKRGSEKSAPATTKKSPAAKSKTPVPAAKRLTGRSLDGHAQDTRSGTSFEDDWDGFDDDGQDDDENEPADTSRSASAFNVLPLDVEDDGFGADVSAWRSINLSEETLAALARLGYSKPTPIQSSAIPSILGGQDVIGKAPTGSGKTLAFSLPILESLLRAPSRTHPLALIIEPTRELAHQIEKHVIQLRSTTTFQKLSMATLTGGLSIQKQRRLLATADIVVATPGRLWEVLEGNDEVLAKLRQIHTLVIDEADRLLGQGHFKELEKVLTALDRNEVDEDGQTVKTGNKKSRQTLVFSATFARELQQKLAKQSKAYQSAKSADSMAYLLKKLNFRAQPRFVDVNPTAPMAENLKEAMLQVPTGVEKDLYLYAALLLHRPHKQTRSLVFVNSIAAVRRIVPFLKYLNLDAIAIHSQMEQKARLKSVERFSRAEPASSTGPASATVLVATDVAARGLDIPEVHTVVHYHVPRTADGYVHRSGRTARAEASGTSILICAPQEAAGVRRLVAQVHAKKSANRKRDLQMIEPEGKIISQLKPRAALAKKIADAEQAKEKQASKESWMAEAANDLGLDADDNEDGVPGFGDASQRKGKNKGKKRKEREAEALTFTKKELGRAKAHLREMLAAPVNTGVSARYLAGGGVDVNALLRQEADALGGGFLGRAGTLL